jgi:hypothetical protein
MSTDTKMVGIEIDQQVMVDAVRDVVQKGLTDGIGSWETQRLVTDAVNSAVNTADLPAQIEAALLGRMEIESGDIVQAVVDETLPLIREAFRIAFRKAMRGMIYGLLRGTPSGYLSDEEKAAWREAQVLLGEESVPA